MTRLAVSYVTSRSDAQTGARPPGLGRRPPAIIKGMSLPDLIRSAAAEAGFDAAGIAPFRPTSELSYFREWIEAGYAGEMRYLESRAEGGELKRSSPEVVFPWARSVVVCVINYNTDRPRSTDDPDPTCGWISRYAWSQRDYHDVVFERLRRLEARLHELAAQPMQSRCYVDTGPLVERVYAKYAGVGWVGKNTCLINQKLGSWLFLGVILTSLELEPDLPAPDRCGSCTRCLDACPTDAFIAPYRMDASRCIAYLTIEKRGDIPEDLRTGIGRQVFGCDICQDVCPWNRKAPATSTQEFQPRAGLVNPALEWLAALHEDGFRETFRASPVKRTKHAGILRNIAVAMGNSGDRKFVEPLRRLAAHPDETVAGHARWSLGKLGAIEESKVP